MARLCIESLHKLFNIQALRLARPIYQSAARLQTEDDGSNEPVDKDDKPQRQFVDVDTSIRYLQSDVYKEAYGEEPIWKHYRRNFMGSLPPKTRTTCVRAGKISTGNPCPVCRDEFLVLGMKNVNLLEQFISPHTGELIGYMKTGLCQQQHKKLAVAVHMARAHGLIEAPVPFREYNYSEYLDKDVPTKKS